MIIEGKRSRILTLDLLRGYFLFVIIVDHTGLFPSVFELFTGRGEMWASAAEGFFIISGLLVGYVYGPRLARNAIQATKKIWQRAFLLYALTVVLTFLFVWWGNHSDIAHIKEGLWTQPPVGEFVLKTLAMQYYYGWADFLPYYAIFMFWAPLALYLSVRGKSWLVLVLSVACWLMRGSSFELSWQLLFMSSLVVGWYLPRIEAGVRALSPGVKRRLTVGLYCSAIVLLVASVLTIRVAEAAVHEYAGFKTLPIATQSFLLGLDAFRDFMTPHIVKWTLEPVRILTAVVWFSALYVCVRQREARLNRLSRGWLTALGERSLVVYVVHAVVICALLLVVNGSHGILLDSLLTAAVVGLISVIARQWTVLTSRRRAATGQERRLQFNQEEA